MATIRIQNIASNTNHDKFLQDVLGCSPAAVLTSSLEMTATVTLRKTSEVQRLLKLDNTTQTGPYSVASRIAIDVHFQGFTVVAGGSNSDLHIVAIHGLNGHAFDSWTVDDVMWLRDLLPAQVPDARVLLYGYNANIIQDASRSRIQEHARLFIKLLQGLAEIQKRRIIFICHSLGGLVLKQALVFIRNENVYSTLRDVALGVIFLGTPHGGSAHADMAQILVNITRISFRANAKQLLTAIKKDSVSLLDLAHSFKEFHSELKIASFCEQLPMKLPGPFSTIDLGLVVDQWSATLADEPVIPVDRDHVTIAKYANASDVVFQLVVNEVKNMAKGIVTSTPLSVHMMASSDNASTRGDYLSIMSIVPLRKGFLDSHRLLNVLDISIPSQPEVTTEDRDPISDGNNMSNSRLPPPSNIDVVSKTSTEVQSADLRTGNTPRSRQPEPVHYAYRIQFRIVDETGQDFRIIDRAVKGTSDIWEVTSLTTSKLKMRGNGTSGSLLLSNSKSFESFSVAAGMHNDKPWCDIVVDVPGNAVSQLITNSYYESRSGRLSANSEKEERTSSRGTIISLTISDLQWDGERIATVLIRNRSHISTSAPPPE
ncbi:fungal fruit body lectin-domain-containing protein [Russula earlei]|uniref:Fungal fruit body lectin-domain-containing protein n=1 Tax=Russula earlei TaxID=71964 RepID=A0ACC0U557_9AGAM|nr:fungal fruit body lectin-domain-containing protein [Russula earlei]